MTTTHVRRRRKRRSCYHRLRMYYLRRVRARTSNPAASAILQLLGVFSFIAGQLPAVVSTPSRYVAPTMSPRQVLRINHARRLGVPVRYLDTVLSQGEVPYRLLFDHIRQGGPMRRDAMTQLRKRVPEVTLDWLDYVEKHANWSELTRCFRRNGSDEETDVILLKATLAWVEDRRKPTEGLAGPADADTCLKPTRSFK